MKRIWQKICITIADISMLTENLLEIKDCFS